MYTPSSRSFEPEEEDEEETQAQMKLIFQLELIHQQGSEGINRDASQQEQLPSLQT